MLRNIPYTTVYATKVNLNNSELGADTCQSQCLLCNTTKLTSMKQRIPLDELPPEHYIKGKVHLDEEQTEPTTNDNE